MRLKISGHSRIHIPYYFALLLVLLSIHIQLRFSTSHIIFILAPNIFLCLHKCLFTFIVLFAPFLWPDIHNRPTFFLLILDITWLVEKLGHCKIALITAHVPGLQMYPFIILWSLEEVAVCVSAVAELQFPFINRLEKVAHQVLPLGLHTAWWLLFGLLSDEELYQTRQHHWGHFWEDHFRLLRAAVVATVFGLLMVAVVAKCCVWLCLCT